MLVQQWYWSAMSQGHGGIVVCVHKCSQPRVVAGRPKSGFLTNNHCTSNLLLFIGGTTVPVCATLGGRGGSCVTHGCHGGVGWGFDLNPSAMECFDLAPIVAWTGRASETLEGPLKYSLAIVLITVVEWRTSVVGLIAMMQVHMRQRYIYACGAAS